MKPCEGCKRKLPTDSHPARRFCSWCQKKRPAIRRKREAEKRAKRRGTGRRRRGPPTKCTPEAIKRYCDAYGSGLNEEHSAGRAGVSAAAVTDWFARARTTLEDAGLSEHEPPDDVLERVPEHERCYVEILLKSQRARADGTYALFASVTSAAMGGAVWERNPNYNPEDPDPDQPPFIQVAYRERDWKAAKHLLAIRHPEYSERQRREISGPGGGPVQTGVIIEMPAELPLSAYVKPESEEGGESDDQGAP